MILENILYFIHDNTLETNFINRFFISFIIVLFYYITKNIDSIFLEKDALLSINNVIHL